MNRPYVRHVKPQPDDKPEVVQLARLLVKAAPLVELVNSPETSHQDRDRLRELVGTTLYGKMTAALRQMCSWRSWAIEHAETEAERQELRKVGLAGISFDGKTVTFYEHGKTSEDETR